MLVIIALSFRSLSVPILLVASIEAAIAINMGIPYFIDDSLPFIASIVIGTIQLGATVDYSILMTTRYREERLALRSPKAAAQQALEHCSQSILTSGLTFFAATFGVAAISKVELLKSICRLISRGALISMVVILLVLPAGLMLLDGLICRTTYHWLNAPTLQGVNAMRKTQNFLRRAGSAALALTLTVSLCQPVFAATRRPSQRMRRCMPSWQRTALSPGPPSASIFTMPTASPVWRTGPP